MATPTTTPNATAPIPAPANGSAPTAPAKRVNKPREAPAIVCAPNKVEYQEIKDALTKLMGGLELNVSPAPFVLACALKTIRAQNK